MANNRERLVCRRATHADYDGVMAINDDVYAGVDYLPVMYHEYIDSPLRYLYVSLLDNQIVGFVMYYMVDGGRSRIGTGARVRPSLQGQGLNNTLIEYARADIHRRFPGIKRVTWTTINTTAAASSLKKHPNTRLLAVRPRFSLDFTSNVLLKLVLSPAFKNLSAECWAHDTSQALPGNAQTVLCDVISVDHFLPEGTWVVDWEPFDHSASNYPIILAKSSLFVTTHLNTEKVRALSFLSCVKVKVGLRVRADFYHHGDDYDAQVMMAHVLNHLLYLSRRYAGVDISYSILYPSIYFPASYVKKRMADVLGLRCTRSLEDACLLLEERLNRVDAKL